MSLSSKTMLYRVGRTVVQTVWNGRGAQRLWRVAALAMLTAGLVGIGPAIQLPGLVGESGVQPAIAQFFRAENVWEQVYQRLPNFPKENQYVSNLTGKVDPNNTLVSRLIRYHLYVKGRPPMYRLDWKLTLSDYLGANEMIQESTYPGRDTLRTNPLESDRAVISHLNRAQRDALVQALVDSFSPGASRTNNSSSESGRSPSNSAPPKPPASNSSGRPGLPSQPAPGAAELLKL